MNENHSLDRLVDDSERLGVIGSPSSNAELAVDILGTAVKRKLVGELALFRFLQDGVSHYALGQVSEVKLRNVWHEEPTMRSLIRQRGRVDAVSERQDTHLAQVTVSAVFRRGGPGGYHPSILGTVPSTGTPIHVVSDEMLAEVLRPYQDQLFYLGHVYGSTPRLPLWFKHFDSGPDGAGEAYHLGIFGKTGSGKSVLAKMILLAYARYPKMALLVVDPQGEFARDIRNGARGDSEFPLPLGRLINGRGRQSFIFSIRNLVLDTWALFEQVLFESNFFERLSVSKGSNRQIAASVLAERLRKAGVRLKALWARDAFDKAWKLLGDEKIQRLFYLSAESRNRFSITYSEASPDEFYKEYWTPVARLFREDSEERPNARTVDQALRWLLDLKQPRRPILVVDLSHEQAEGLFWNDTIQSLVISRLLDGLTRTAEKEYRDGRSLNAMVVIDEAHRLAPREVATDDDAIRRVRGVLVDAARTTRKYGLGWLFISQTLSSLHSEILQQLRIMFFGFGLSLGQEYVSLRQLVGSSGATLDLYTQFRDPHSAFEASSRAFSFMTIGPVSPLSFAGTPLFLNVFNTVEAFLAANRLEVPAPVRVEP